MKNRTHVRWTEEENTILDVLAGTTRLEIIAQKLKKASGVDRSINSIRSHLNRRGLSSAPEVDNWNAMQLSKLLELKRDSVWNWVRDGKLKTQKLGNKHIISRKNFNEFCYKYPQLVARTNEKNLLWVTDDKKLTKWVKQHRSQDLSAKRIKRKDTGVVYASVHQAAKSLGMSRPWVTDELKRPDGWLELVS